MNKTKDTLRNQQGVGLLELITSILIGAILILAITTMYGNFIGASRIQGEQSNAQDQANFAFLRLNRAVRMSGAGLCSNPVLHANTYFHQATTFSEIPTILQRYGLINENVSAADFEKFNKKSRLYSFTASPSGSDTNIRPLAGTDALLVIYSDSNIRRIKGSLKEGSRNELLPPQQSSRFHRRKLNEPLTDKDPVFYKKAGDVTWVMISDCEHTGVLEYTASETPEKNSDILPLPKNGNFLYNFGGNGEETLIGRLHAELFFIAKDSKSSLPQLYYRDLLSPDDNPKPLAVYVKNMKVQYRNPSTNAWVEGSARTDWNREWPVRVTLTMDSGKELGEQNYSRVLGIRN